MAEVKWIKIATDMFDNRKIKQIRKLPEGDSIIAIWVQILCLAGQINDSGMVYFAKDIPYTEEMLAVEFDRTINLIRIALATFEKFSMIEIVDCMLLVSNWEKYQSTDKLQQIREQNRLRQQKFKEKQKLLSNSNVSVTLPITQGNATDIDIDKDIDIYNNIPLKKESKIFNAEDKEYLLAEYLSKQISKRLDKPLKEEKILQNWSADFEKMVRLDKYDIEEMKEVLIFSQKNDFWQSNILSAGKFRKQYLTLLGQMKRDNNKSSKEQQPKANNKFHNFNQKITNMSESELEEIARKRNEKLKNARLKNESDI